LLGLSLNFLIAIKGQYKLYIFQDIVFLLRSIQIKKSDAHL